MLDQRDSLWKEGKLDDPMFAPAHQFAGADKIVVAAPFWDLSFPAALKIYLERISVTGITFGYDADGNSVGLCKADRLLYITTRGGCFSGTPMDVASCHIRGLGVMYGIPDVRFLDAEGLDDVRNDPEALLAAAMERADAMAEVF